MDKSNFKVKELIGEGGQAKVYKVVWGDKDYALKIFRHEKYFRREISRFNAYPVKYYTVYEMFYNDKFDNLNYSKIHSV